MTANEKVKTTIRLPDELADKLTQYAYKQDLSKNQVVKQALKKLLNDNEASLRGEQHGK